jgi:peptidoglycan/LPS O-acetylase OafA/YrhL
MTKFRYDINALRAIAVLSVLLFHLRIPFFSGGFVGVDVFFVISGYLMTRIIFDGIDKNNFSLFSFWGKRLKRIVPALMVMVLVISAVGFFFYLPNEYKINEGNANASLLFFSNISYWKNSGYFDSASENNIFLHTWSLSVEWQFYLLYPIVLWAISKINKIKNYIPTIFVVASILLCGLSIFWTYRSATASFYLLPMRMWEMLVGGLALVFEGKFAFQNKSVLFISYVTIILSTILLNNQLHWPGIFTLIPIAATFFVILSNQNNHKLIQNRVIQFTGKISYSLYLWHWPLIVFAQYMGYQLSILTIAIIITLSFLFAYLSFTYIESIKLKYVPIVIVFAVLSISTNVLNKRETNRWVFKKTTLDMAEYASKTLTDRTKQFSENCCFVTKSEEKLEDFRNRTCIKIDSTKKNFLLLGDSHAACLSSSFREEFAKRNINFLQATAAYGFAFLDDNGPSNFCHQLYRYMFYDFLIKNKQHIDGVILGGNWYPHPKEIIEPSLKVIKYLKSLGIPVVIIGQTNVYTIPFPSIIAKGLENNSNVTDFYADKKTAIFNDFMKEKLSANYIDVYFRSDIPKLSPNLEPYLFDTDHLSKYGADLAVQKIFADPLFHRFLEK